MFMFEADLKFTVFYYPLKMTNICKETMRACRHVIYRIWIHVKIISNETVDIFRIDITIQMDSG